MIFITEKAANQVKEISDRDGVGHYIVRAKVQGGGCGGYQTELEFDNQISETDEVIEFDGIKVIIDMISYHYLNNCSIDYTDGLISSGFCFNMPDDVKSCGCGKSFAF
jgi:iron-sulfur cluster assembly accessory protein